MTHAPEGFHHYLPFGAEWTTTSGAQEGEPMKFTGHERDRNPGTGTDGLDYMHARYYSSGVGRFLSVDPYLDVKKNLAEPQRWNRYAYVTNNPVNAVDPDGRDTYRINRTIGGFAARSPWNPLTHTFIATTSGGVIQTYSWGNTPDQFTQNGWNENKPEDLVAALQALNEGLATKVGDDSLDPYVKAAFDSLKTDPMSNHWNLGILLNCKFEARSLIHMAEQARRKDQNKQSFTDPPGALRAQPPQPDKRPDPNKTSFAPCVVRGNCPGPGSR